MIVEDSQVELALLGVINEEYVILEGLVDTFGRSSLSGTDWMRATTDGKPRKSGLFDSAKSETLMLHL